MQVIKSDITQLSVDAIVNAANAVGIMGAGVAGAIKKAGGLEISREARKICSEYRFQPGSAYYTKAGRLECKHIIHAVTMKWPGQKSSIEIVEKCVRSVFNRAKQLGCSVIAIPGLGTKIGRIPPERVARLYKELIPVMEAQYNIEVIVCDIDEKFIEEMKTV